MLCVRPYPSFLLRWEHSLTSLQRATCLQKPLYPSLGKVTRQQSAAGAPICCGGSFSPLWWPRQGDPEQRGVRGCLGLLGWAAVGRPRSKGTVLATAHTAKNPHNNLFVYVFKIYSQDQHVFRRGKKTNITERGKSSRFTNYPHYELQMTVTSKAFSMKMPTFWDVFCEAANIWDLPGILINSAI